MKLKIEITMDNAAFDESPEAEIGSILADLSDKVIECEMRMRPGESRRLCDTNGNHVGTAKVTR